MLDAKSNTKLYKKCIHKMCRKNQFCSFERMKPVMDKAAVLNQPLPHGTHPYAMRLNDAYSDTDYPDRNLILKNKGI